MNYSLYFSSTSASLQLNHFFRTIPTQTYLKYIHKLGKKAALQTPSLLSSSEAQLWGPLGLGDAALLLWVGSCVAVEPHHLRKTLFPALQPRDTPPGTLRPLSDPGFLSLFNHLGETNREYMIYGRKKNAIAVYSNYISGYPAHTFSLCSDLKHFPSWL